ncbi:MAG: glutamate racemase [Thermotogota bacterium]|nr:glutamate racemase [Thermotogota bacterium]
MAKKRIGIFDSGIGGITVLKELLDSDITGVTFIYVADTAHVPYGSKPRRLLHGYINNILDFLIKFDVSSIICACNTSDSILSDEEKSSLGVDYISVIDSAVGFLSRILKGKNNIAIIGTETTVRRSVYLRKLISLKQIKNVYQKACPLFVPMVEEGLWEGELVEKIVSFYLNDIRDIGVDRLILGCTHYPFLKKAIVKFIGSEIAIDDPSVYLAKQFKQEPDKNEDAEIGVEYYVTGDPKMFEEQLSIIDNNLLTYPVKKIEEVNSGLDINAG